MMQRRAVLEMLRGSNVGFRIIWPGAEGQPFDLTGWEVKAFEPHARLNGNLTLDIADAPAGVIIGSIAWDDKYPNGNVMNFRVQVSRGDQVMSTPEFMVNVK